MPTMSEASRPSRVVRSAAPTPSFRRSRRCKGDLTGRGEITERPACVSSGNALRDYDRPVFAGRASAPAASAPGLPRPRPLGAPRARNRADRAGLAHPQGQGQRRHCGRARRRPSDLAQDPIRPAQPRLSGRADADGRELHLRRRRERRPRPLLQPARGRAHAPRPRRRVDRPHEARRGDALPRVPPRLDGRRLPPQPERGAADPAGRRRPHGRGRPRAHAPVRPDRLQLGRRPGRPRRDGLHDEPRRAAAPHLPDVPVARRARARGRRRGLPRAPSSRSRRAPSAGRGLPRAASGRGA